MKIPQKQPDLKNFLMKKEPFFDINKIIKEYNIKELIYQFSGGRDSQLSCYITHAQKPQIKEKLFFIDTCDYDDDIYSFVHDFSKNINLKLDTIEKDIRGYLKDYTQTGTYVNYNCRLNFIMQPTYSYGYAQSIVNEGNILIITGSKSSQSFRRYPIIPFQKARIKGVYVLKPLCIIPKLYTKKMFIEMYNKFKVCNVYQTQPRTACKHCPFHCTTCNKDLD